MKRAVLAAVAALALAGCAVPADTSQLHKTAATQAPPAAAEAPAPSPSASVTRVHFSVTGTGQPSIDYGSDSDTRSPGNLGILGDGNALPFKAGMPFDPSAQFYSITAQLEGPGKITCKIVVTGPGYIPLTVATGHAQSSNNGAICSAQAAPDNAQGTSWSKE